MSQTGWCEWCCASIVNLCCSGKSTCRGGRPTIQREHNKGNNTTHSLYALRTSGDNYSVMRCGRVGLIAANTHAHILEICENRHGQHQRNQTDRVARIVDDGRQLDVRLETGDRRLGVRHVRAQIVIGVIVPGAIRMAESRCIVCGAGWNGGVDIMLTEWSCCNC